MCKPFSYSYEYLFALSHLSGFSTHFSFFQSFAGLDQLICFIFYRFPCLWTVPMKVIDPRTFRTYNVWLLESDEEIDNPSRNGTFLSDLGPRRVSVRVTPNS